MSERIRRTESAQFIAAARSLFPQIKAVRNEIERERDLPPPLVAAMGAAGLYMLWLARSLGGPELTIADFIRVIEEVARADGSVGWCCMLAATYSRFSGNFDEETARAIFGDGTSVVAGNIGPLGKAIIVPGGFRLTGRWPYGSFIRHSKWVLGGAVVHDDRRGLLHDADGQPDVRILFFPKHAVEIIDTWRVSGLRGTGSHDYVVNDLFVAEQYAIPRQAPRSFQCRPLYAAPLISSIRSAIPAVSIGIARAAIDAFTDLAQGKIPAYGSAQLCKKPSAQNDLARAEALLRSGRAFLLEAIEEFWEELVAGRTPSVRQRAMISIACAQAAAASAQAVDLLYNAAGGSALYESNPLERCFRDVHATTQHVATQASNFEVGGRVLFGFEPGTLSF